MHLASIDSAGGAHIGDDAEESAFFQQAERIDA
jgi:hypothetical protein